MRPNPRSCCSRSIFQLEALVRSLRKRADQLGAIFTQCRTRCRALAEHPAVVQVHQIARGRRFALRLQR